jgi:hypothetical protein
LPLDIEINLSMSLIKELKIQTLVLLAKQPADFKPSEFNQYWLDLNKIIPANSLNKLSTFSPLLVQAISEKISIVVTQDQIQIAPTSPDIFKEVITVNAVALIKAMDDISLNGMGLNFNWYLRDEKVGYEELSIKYFLNEKNPATKFFNDGNQMFGDYLSKEINDDIRLKLDIKPTQLHDIKENKSYKAIQFAFNFHSDLKVENQKEKLLEILSNYDKWLKITSDIIESFN